MADRSANVWVRRFRNLPHSSRNIGRMVWHPLRNIIFLLCRQITDLFRLPGNMTQPLWYLIRRIAYLLLHRLGIVSSKNVDADSGHPRHYNNGQEASIFILLLCIPAAILFAFKNRPFAKKYLFALIPKLGMLHQHKLIGLNEFTVSESPGDRAQEEPLKLAVVTPSWQQGNFIRRTIRSVLDQGYSNLDYVVQDGGSDDGTLDVLNEFSDERLVWESVPDNGQADALNRGVRKLAEWDVMCYLNSDDLLLPGTIQRVVDIFQDNPAVDVVYGNRLMIDEQDGCIGEWILPRHDGFILSYADYIPQETMFWRKSIWGKTGAGFDDSFQFAMDWDLILRFRNAGARFLHTPAFLGAFRIHETQKSQAIIGEVGSLEMDRLRERELGYVPSFVTNHCYILPFMVRHVISDFKFRYLNRNQGNR